jgi:hypothetical protein
MNASTVLALAVAIVAQQPARDTPAQPVITGTAVISGVIVTDDATPQPVRKARVTLNPAGLATPGRTATTDDAGRFTFRDVPAGRFRLEATKPGFLTTSYGAKRADRPGTPVSLTDGQHLSGISVRLARGGAISGTVLDQNGRPAAGLTVRVLRAGFSTVTGERTLGSVGGAGGGLLTDDRGSYRAWGLPPGDYAVVVTPPAMRLDAAPGLESIRRFTSDEMQRALARARAGGGPGVSEALRPTASPSTVPVSYAPVFFPGVVDPSQATMITLGLGEERDGITLSLQFTPVARVGGSVKMPDGTPLQNVMLTLAPSADAQVFAAAGAIRPIITSPLRDGTFSFLGITPGSYTVTAKSSPAAAASGAPVTPGTYSAVADIDVNGTDVDLAVEMQPGMTVYGRVMFPGASAPPDPSLLRFRIVPPGAGGDLSAGPAGGQVDATGKFSFAGVTAGKYRWTYIVTSAGALGPWRLQSAVAGGRDVFDAPLDVRPGPNLDVVVTFTDRPAQLTGVLQSAAGAAAPDYFIIVFSTDKSQWRPASRRVQMVRPATDGRFIAYLPAGDYWIAALTDVAANEWYDPAFIAQLPTNVRITITDGQTTTQDLKIER